ncbi:SEC-C domain-containing protein [Lacisediminihabitans profunda]|uniref:SEC-C domain-containing protein n=1 Tax=Lacisediminihabitans profunda TaxID=2594790 RepID=A0A5C8UN73_9MICO|nr:SEC-C domain-containing protein [Lacisediminihabitans profunda]TXN29318.1 SEC-C domain-containing protein [Lacisediminihabitans profunda]
MTLVTVVATSTYFVHVADRRLTGPASLPNEQNKTIILHMPSDLTMVVGYAGLAHFAHKPMNQELMRLFCELYRTVEGDITEFLKGIRGALDSRFSELDIARLNPRDKRFSLIVTAIGRGTRVNPLVSCSTFSNYRDLHGTAPDALIAAPAFSSRYDSLEPSPGAPNPGVIITVGDDASFGPRLDDLLELVAQGKPARFVRDRVVADMASTALTHPTISGDVHSVTIDRSFEITTDYHVTDPTGVMSFPDHVGFDEQHNCIAASGATLSQGTDPNHPVGIMVRPKQSKKSRCWCGSGKRFDSCHGRRACP